MIHPKKLVKILDKNKIEFFSGVPDSVLKYLTPYFGKQKNKHYVTPNEGSAIALAAGYYLATKKIPCVYLQNSGLGNSINPLTSITHEDVYAIPMLLLIGWRGSPNQKDEPQHKVKGKITKKLLELLNIKCCSISKDKDLNKLSTLINYSKKNNKTVACLIENRSLLNDTQHLKINNLNLNLRRAYVIQKILSSIKTKTNIIATTGFTSRELMEIEKKNHNNKINSFYMVGGMGHASLLSLGVSLNSSKNVCCLDGDGSLLMHMGSMASIGFFAKKNFKHILFNNNSHESVGGQPTNAIKLNFKELSKGFGYKKYFLIKNKSELTKVLKNFLSARGPVFLEILINQGSLKNLMRPKDLIMIKKKFMRHIK